MLFCRLSIRRMLIASWLIILELQNWMCGSQAVSLVDPLGAMLVVTILAFHACMCGTVSIVASGGVSLITCGAALWGCVLAWSGGAISGCVIFGNVPGKLRRVMCWCARFCLQNLLRGRNVGQHSWSCIAHPLNHWSFFSAYVSKHPLFFIPHPLFWCRRGGLPKIYEIYASRCCARHFRTLRVLALHSTVSMLSWSSNDSSRMWL